MQRFFTDSPQRERDPNEHLTGPFVQYLNPDPREDLESRSPNLGPYTAKGTLLEPPLRDLLFGSSRGSGKGRIHGPEYIGKGWRLIMFYSALQQCKIIGSRHHTNKNNSGNANTENATL